MKSAWEQLWNTLRKKQVLIAVVTFIAVYCTYYFYFCITWKDAFPWDSGLYWDLGSAAFNFPQSYRGYFFPLVLGVMMKIGFLFPGGTQTLGFHLCNSFLFTVATCLLIPALFGSKPWGLRRAVGCFFFTALFLFYFGDLFIYPLSDMPAIILFICALLFTIKLERELGEKDEKGSFWQKYRYLLYSGIAGASLYAAYNTRTIYLFPAFVLVVCFAIKNRKNYKKLLKCVLPFFLCMLVIMAPQMAINYKYEKKISPKVFTTNWAPADNGLLLWQIQTGITFERYETYVGDSALYPSPGVVFMDDTGKAIMEKEQIENLGYAQAIKLFLTYPLDFIGIYTRHLVTYFTLIFNKVYIESLNVNFGLVYVSNFLMWFLFGLSLFSIPKSDKKMFFKRQGLYWLTLLVPCILFIPGAPESRFYIPLYLLAYGYLVFCVNYKALLQYIKKNCFTVLSIFIILFCGWTAINGSVMADLQHMPLLFNNQ